MDASRFARRRNSWHDSDNCSNSDGEAALADHCDCEQNSFGVAPVDVTNLVNLESVELLAANPLTNPRTLTTLAFHPSLSVRQCLANNPQTPVSALMTLAQDENIGVRFQLAKNDKISPFIIRILAQDDNHCVRWTAIDTLSRQRSQLYYPNS